MPRFPNHPVADQPLRREGGEARPQRGAHVGLDLGSSSSIFGVGASIAYLGLGHQVATCRLPRCCLHCHGFRHKAHDCERQRSKAEVAASTGRSSCMPLMGVCVLGGRAWSWTSSLRFGSVIVKATSGFLVDSSMLHPLFEIPAADEVVVHSSLP